MGERRTSSTASTISASAIPTPRSFAPTTPKTGRSAGRAGEFQSRVAGGGPDCERPRNGRAGPHSTRRGPRADPAQSQTGKERRQAPSAGQAIGVADRQRAGPDEPLAKERPRLQPVRPDDQGGLPREVVEITEADPGECGRNQDRRAKNDGECNDDDLGANDYALIQYNFSLFFGLSVQLYESTLVSDDTPWDRFRRSTPRRPTRL